MLSHVGGDATTESVARDIGRCFADIAANELHGIPTVAAEKAVAERRLTGGTIDDGNKVFSDDEAVFVLCAMRVLRNGSLLDDLHKDKVLV